LAKRTPAGAATLTIVDGRFVAELSDAPPAGVGPGATRFTSFERLSRV